MAAAPVKSCAVVEEPLRECAEHAWALLERNSVREGILAATPSAAAGARGYVNIFGRDAAICALAMLGSGRPRLERAAIASLDTLSRYQADNGQIPKYVDPARRDADFWYLGCIDATLWWLIAADCARRRARPGERVRWRRKTARALNWLQCQEHQKFFLLQQNEASDWADIMPRSGFVLYTNALWYHVKRIYDLPNADATHYHFNHLFHPFNRDLDDYRRARLLAHYVRRRSRADDLYLSFVNFSYFGSDGDVFGNVLAILFGLAGDSRAESILQILDASRVAEPYPVRVVTNPIARSDPMWRAYMGRHRQNLEHQYHNGGIWPFVGGFWVMALAALGKSSRARAELERLGRVNSLDDWRFTEWYHGRSLVPMGMAGQSWNAATWLLAAEALAARTWWQV